MARLSLRQKKRITNKFSLTLDDYQLIRQNGGDWESRNKDMVALKDRIRNHYKEEQGKICVYCKLPLYEEVHAEHIVPKSGIHGRPEYSFYPINIAASCWHCNTKKSTNNEMIPWDKIPYSFCGQDFKIIHPHYDDYFDHIEIANKSMYVRKTVKGHHTIQRCKLNEPAKLEHLAEAMMYQDNPLFEAMIRISKMRKDYEKIIDRFVERCFGK